MPKRVQADTSTATPPPAPKTRENQEAKRAKVTSNPSNGSKRAPKQKNTPPTTAKSQPDQKSDQKSDPIPYRIASKPTLAHSGDQAQPIVAMLSPASPQEECPLTLEPIATSRLPFLPDCAFLDHLPHYTKLTLPCGHGFSAVPLIYHMCKNNMLCPICRAGSNLPADTQCIPAHFREPMAAQIASTRTTERNSDMQEVMSSLVGLHRSTTSFAEIAIQGNLHMVLTFSNPPQSPDSGSPNSSGTTIDVSLGLFPVTERTNGVDRVVFRPRPSHMRLLEQIQGIGSVLSASTFVTIPAVGDIEIEGVQQELPTSTENADLTRRVVRGNARHAWSRHSRSALADLSQDNSVAPGARREVSTFEFGFGREDQAVFVNYVSWRPDMSHVTWAFRVEP